MPTLEEKLMTFDVVWEDALGIMLAGLVALRFMNASSN